MDLEAKGKRYIGEKRVKERGRRGRNRREDEQRKGVEQILKEREEERERKREQDKR